jgi:peroxiredoxin
MELALLIIRFVLIGVFAAAGFTKLADRAGTRQAIIDFGLPVWLALPIGIMLPMVELATAAALMAPATAWWGAAGALILLVIFSGGILYNLIRGRTPDCHCFGQLHSEPIGRSTLVRNGVLGLIAGLIVAQGPNRVGSSVLDGLTNLTAVQIFAFVIVLGLFAAEGRLLLHLMRQNGRLLLRIEALENATSNNRTRPAPAATQPAAGLPVGAPAPIFQLPDLNGEILTLDALLSKSKPVMLIFTDPGCGPCNALMPEIADWQRDHATQVRIALISRGTVESNHAKQNGYDLKDILLQHDREVVKSFQAYGTPSAVLVRADGMIGSAPAAGATAIRTLLAQTVGMPIPLPPPSAASSANDGCNCGKGNGNGNHQRATVQATKIGQAAPALRLPNLDGTITDLTAFRGYATLVLFWNPGCGFCGHMLNELKAWEASPPQDAPQLLLVSEGTGEDNQAMGLRSTVVIDRNFSMGRLFGANGTPSAVLVDAMGNIASEVAVGAPAVLRLAGVVGEP